MLLLKLFVQILSGISGLTAILLDYKWYDKRRIIFKRSRNILITITVLSLVSGVIITIIDEKEKEQDIALLQDNLNNAKNTLNKIMENGDTLRNQIRPFLEIASSKFPNLDSSEALKKLIIRLNTTDDQLLIESKRTDSLQNLSKNLEKRTNIIQSFELYLVIDEITPPSPLSNKETSSGVQSAVALFSKDNTRMRLVTDFSFTQQQITATRRKITLTYRPEDKNQIIGHPIKLLNDITIFAFDYSTAPEIFGEANGYEIINIDVVAFINGIRIPINYIPKSLSVALKRQIDLSVKGTFNKISDIYSKTLQSQL